MLLLIDEKKIKDQLTQVSQLYAVYANNLEEPRIADQNLTISVTTAAMALPPEWEKARDRVLALRKRLIESSNKPLSQDELEKMINETRGRS